MKRSSWRTVGSIAKHTFYETIRDKVLYSLIGFAVLVIAAGLLAGSVSLGQDVRVIESFSLTAMLVFLLIITLFVGTQLVSREVERKTVYFVLSKPVSRAQFYLGKYIGICATLTVSAVIMSVLFFGVVLLKTHTLPVAALWATLLLMLESWLLTAIGLLFSTFTSPIASAIYTFCLALIGQSATTILVIANKNSGFLKLALKGVYYLFPNLDKFNLSSEVVYNIHPAASEIGSIVLYFVCYTAALVLLGLWTVSSYEF